MPKLKWTALGLLGCGVLLAAPQAQAEDRRVALVVSVTAYPQAAALPECREAARDVAAQLRAGGYAVLESHDASTPALQGSIDAFSRRAAEAPGAPALLYVCARAVVDRGRLFLLPAGAPGPGAMDLATQAVLAKAFIRATPEAGGLLAMDLRLEERGDSLASASRVLRDDAGGGTGIAALVTARPGATALSRAMRDDPVRGLRDWTDFALAVRALPGGQDVLFQPAPQDRPPPPVAAPAVQAPPAEGPGVGAGMAAAPPPDLAQGPGSAAVTALPAGPGGEALGATVTLALPLPPPPPPAPPAAPPTALLGRPAEAVSARDQRIRAALAARGLGRGVPDGRAGLEAAVQAYQQSLGRSPTGRLTGTEVLMLMNGS